MPEKTRGSQIPRRLRKTVDSTVSPLYPGHREGDKFERIDARKVGDDEANSIPSHSRHRKRKKTKEKERANKGLETASRQAREVYARKSTRGKRERKNKK